MDHVLCKILYALLRRVLSSGKRSARRMPSTSGLGDVSSSSANEDTHTSHRAVGYRALLLQITASKSGYSRHGSVVQGSKDPTIAISRSRLPVFPASQTQLRPF